MGPIPATADRPVTFAHEALDEIKGISNEVALAVERVEGIGDRAFGENPIGPCEEQAALRGSGGAGLIMEDLRGLRVRVAALHMAIDRVQNLF